MEYFDDVNLSNEEIEEITYRQIEKNCIINLLTEIIKRDHRDLLYDYSFIFLDKGLDIKQDRKIFIDLLATYQRRFLSENFVPELEAVHEKLVSIVSENDELLKGLTAFESYPLDFTINFLKRIELKYDNFTFIKHMNL